MSAPKPAEPPLPPPWPFPTRPPEPMTNERIDYIADLVVKGMPDGLRGFCKTWGWQQFARALLHDCRATIDPHAQLAEALRHTREQHRDCLDALKAIDFLEACLSGQSASDDPLARPVEAFTNEAHVEA